MSLYSRQIPSLFNGVSQQPATLRLPSQCEEQVNGYSTVVDGLRKRPPFEHVAKVTSSSLSGSAYIHTINRDTSERYIVVITDGDLKVYDLDGVEQTVNFPLGKTYLGVSAGADVRDSFAVVSIADYSFVVNKTVTVATKAAPTSEPSNLGTWFTPGTWAYDVTSPEIAAQFFNPAQGTYRGSVQTFQDLPNPDDPDDTPPVEGDTWKVAGYDEDSFGAYYVVRRGGVWEETFKPNSSITLDEETMPWALVRESDGTFSFKPFAWKARKYGDEDSNPPPTFVGKTLEDVFYYKNRLGFLADENVVFSCASDYGNFWRNTVTDLLDSDVVDIAVSSSKVSLLKYAVPFNNSLMLFADQTQFALNVDELLTPTSVSIDTVTEFEMSTKVRPVGIGNDVYFVTETGNHSRLREYFVQEGNTFSTDAADVTAHVPRYLPKNIVQMAGNSNEDALFLVSSDHPMRIYNYKFWWNTDGKVQSAWSYWDLDDGGNAEILAIAFLDNVLYALIERTDGVYLERCDIQSGYVTGALDHPVLLDRLCEVTGVYFGVGDYTEFTLPYPVYNQGNFELVRGADFSAPESLVDPSSYTWVDSTTLRVPGNVTDGECHGGMSYTMRFRFSEQFMMRGEAAITTGRLQLRTFTIYFQDTAFFQTSVDPYGNGGALVESIIPASLSQFTAKTLGADSLTLNQPSYETGQYSFQVYGNSRQAVVELQNDTHVQCRFQSAEWEGLYFNRARF